MKLLALIALVLFCQNSFVVTKNLTADEIEKNRRLIEGRGLYTDKDHMIILTGKNFDDEVYGKPYALLVEFYSSWCGFCRRFAGTWKTFSFDVKDWKDVVRVGAIDCYEYENVPTCRQFHIRETPTLLYFRENSNKTTSRSEGSPIDEGRTLEDLKTNLVKHFIEEQQNNHAKQLPNIVKEDDKITFDNLSKNAKIILYLYDGLNSSFGPQLAITLRNSSVIAVQWTYNPVVVKKAGYRQTDLPILEVVDVTTRKELNTKNGTKLSSLIKIVDFARRTVGPDMRKYIPKLPKYKHYFNGDWLNTTAAPDLADIKEERNIRRLVKKLGDVVFAEDLEIAVLFSFRNEIAMRDKIEGESLKALKAYLRILLAYFPFTEKLGNSFSGVLKTVEAGQSISGSVISELIHKAEKGNVFSFPPEFIACRGSLPTLRGYTCSLWKLFHYLTVNALLKPNPKIDITHREPLDAVVGYVRNFFTCGDCRRHFLKVVNETKPQNLKSLKSGVLWLWKTHNVASKRLAKDVTEDPEFPKIQFPGLKQCPKCRYSNGTWSENDVIEYLKKVYSEKNILQYVKGKAKPWKPHP